MNLLVLCAFSVLSIVYSPTSLAHSGPDKTKFVSIDATTNASRTKLLELGINIEEVYSDRVWSLVNDEEIARAKAAGYKILSEVSSSVFEKRIRGFLVIRTHSFQVKMLAIMILLK
jgi:hypothetical protein